MDQRPTVVGYYERGLTYCVLCWAAHEGITVAESLVPELKLQRVPRLTYYSRNGHEVRCVDCGALVVGVNGAGRA